MKAASLSPVRRLLTIIFVAMLTALGALAAETPAVKPADGKVVPKAEEKKPAEPAPKIEGVALARKDGRWLGLAVESGKFVLRFYDKEKKPLKQPDAARASARWKAVGKVGEQRAVLNPASEGAALTAPQFVSPPLTFKVYLTLLDAEGNALENFVADLGEIAPK